MNINENNNLPGALPAAVQKAGTFPKLERAARAAVAAMSLSPAQHAAKAAEHKAICSVLTGADAHRHEFMARAHAEVA